MCSFLSKYSLLLSKSRFICVQRRNVSAWYFESDSPDWVSSLATRLLELGTLSVFLGWKIKLCNFFTHFFLWRKKAKQMCIYRTSIFSASESVIFIILTARITHLKLPVKIYSEVPYQKLEVTTCVFAKIRHDFSSKLLATNCHKSYTLIRSRFKINTSFWS